LFDFQEPNSVQRKTFIHDIVDVLKTEEPFHLTTNFPTNLILSLGTRIAFITFALFIIVLCAVLAIWG